MGEQVERASRIVKWRERFNLTQTVKDGWRVGDFTIEYEYEGLENAPTNAEVQQRAGTVALNAQTIVDELNRLRSMARGDEE